MFPRLFLSKGSVAVLAATPYGEADPKHPQAVCKYACHLGYTVDPFLIVNRNISDGQMQAACAE
jgi:hypothetical protein